MQRFLLYPSEVFSVDMNSFTASGSDRLVCALGYVSAFLVKLIV